MLVNFSYLILGLVVAAFTILVNMVPELHYRSDNAENFEKHMQPLRERLDLISTRLNDITYKLDLEHNQSKTIKKSSSKDRKYWKTIKDYKLMGFLIVLFIFSVLLFIFDSDIINYVFIGIYSILVFQRLEPIVADIIDLPTVKILETLQVDDINELLEEKQLEPVSYYNSQIILYSTEVFGSYILFNTNTGFLVKYSVNTAATKMYKNQLVKLELLEEKLYLSEKITKDFLDITQELEETKNTVKNRENEIKELKKKKELLESE